MAAYSELVEEIEQCQIWRDIDVNGYHTYRVMFVTEVSRQLMQEGLEYWFEALNVVQGMYPRRNQN